MYIPRPVPEAFDVRWLQEEFQRVAQEQGQIVPMLRLQTLYAAPLKISDGMVVMADGTTWNPGGGAGIYARVSGAWVKL